MNGITPQGPAPMPNSEDNNPVVPGGTPVPPATPQGPSVPPKQVPSQPPAPQAPPPPPPPLPTPQAPPPPPKGLGNEVPPPPQGQEVSIRTMASDKKSIKSSGGLGVESKTFKPSDLAVDPAFEPQSKGGVEKENGSKKKLTLIIVGVLVALGITAGAVYFFVLPLFSPDTPEIVIDEPVVQEEPAESAVVPTPSFTHQSFFKSALGIAQEIALEAVSLSQINTAMLSIESPLEGSIQEVAFTVNSTPASSKDLLGTTLPSLDTTIFDKDFTTFIYYDENGTWPGYIFLLNGLESTLLARGEVTENVEASTILPDFYLSSPGEQGESFSDGFASGLETRYTPFLEEGASFNYGWKDRYLILSTSFDGFQEAVGLLGETETEVPIEDSI